MFSSGGMLNQGGQLGGLGGIMNPGGGGGMLNPGMGGIPGLGGQGSMGFGLGNPGGHPGTNTSMGGRCKH